MKKDKETKCDVCKIKYFERNNYFFGKLMTVRDFFAEQCYFNDKRWLINRMINGWGVVCGLDVVKPKENDPWKVIVKPGLAIDCCGREILVCEDREVPLVPEESQCHKEKREKEKKIEKLAICIRYIECKTEPLHIPPIACDQKEKCEFNRIRDSFKIEVLPFREKKSQEDPFCPETEAERKKSLHQYLCEKLRKECPEPTDADWIILATLKVDEDGNLIGEIDKCSQRKLVYSNPLLYDLIHCFHGDLPHVTKISWMGAHRKVLEWKEFKKIVDSGLTVTFDKFIEHDSINRHTFLFEAITVDKATGYMQSKYIPSGKIDVKDVKDVKKKYTEATFVIEDGWKDDELEGKHSEIIDGADFRIILKGSAIISSEGKALDGDFIGEQLPSGNGIQGGDFMSWFSVNPRPEGKKEKISK